MSSKIPQRISLLSSGANSERLLYLMIKHSPNAFVFLLVVFSQRQMLTQLQDSLKGVITC
jgi:hypothetical protein